MELLGARLVIGSETEDGRSLDEATMKRLTGGDPLTARRLYREPVTWIPTHQLLYVTNHLPNVKGNDPAVWRRVRVVPFGVVVPVEDRDPNLSERSPARRRRPVVGHGRATATGTSGGMREPASVLAATGAYQADTDAVARFIAEACEVSPHATPPPASSTPHGSGGHDATAPSR